MDAAVPEKLASPARDALDVSRGSERISLYDMAHALAACLSRPPGRDR
jgi:hypothetical protein